MIIFILILATGLRLISLNQSLWLDEAINVTFASKLSLFDFLTKYSIADFHPPGYFFILWIWIRAFGNSEIAVRLPSALLGVATVYLTYLVGKNLLSQKIGFLAALLLAIAPLHLYYSQEARMYSLAAFAVSLSFYFLIQLIDQQRSKKNIIFYAFSIVLVLYSDYVAYLILPVQLIWAVWQKPKLFKNIFLGQFIGGLFLTPWLFIFPTQLLNGQHTAQAIPGWKGVVGGNELKDLALVWIKMIVGRINFENKIIYTIIVGVLSAVYGAIIYPLVKQKNILIIWCWFILPVVFAFLASFFIPILSYFRLLFIIPAFTILLATGLDKVSQKWKMITISLVLIINLVFCLVYLFNPKYQREDWKGLVHFFNSNPSPTAILFENNDTPAPFVYALNCQNKKGCYSALGALKNFPTKSESDVIDFGTLLAPNGKVYLVDYLVDITDPERFVAKSLKELGFTLTKTYNFNGVGFVYEYSK